jgi:Leucine-rich repeat (LRR) protein
LKKLRHLNLAATPITDQGLKHLEGLTALQELALDYTGVSDAGLARLGALPKLQSLSLSHAQVADAGVNQLRALTNLQRLVLPSTKVTDAGLSYLERLTALRDIDLNGTNVGDAGMASLAAIKKLRGVSLSGTRVTDAGLIHFKGVQHLLGLDLTDTRVSDAGLAHLAGLTGLQNLRLSGTLVTDPGLAHLAGMKDMEQLRLTRTHVHDAGLVHLEAMKKLRELYLDGTGVTDAGLMQLLSLPLPPLQVLDLSGSRVSATGAAAVKGILAGARVEWWEPNRRAAEAVLAAGGSVHVRAMPRGSDVLVKTAAALPADYFRLTRASLQGLGKPSHEVLVPLANLTDPEFDDLDEVDLTASAVSDVDLESLGSLTCRRLVLNRCPVAGPGLVHLKKLARMTDLSVECPSLSFLGVRYAGELKQLERLSLAGSGATDASLKNLHDLVRLREIDLTGTKVTAEGVTSLRKVLPMCDVKAVPTGPK